MNNIVLAVVAHPDDEVLGIAGTLIRHVNLADEVHILILADGESSRPGGEARREYRLNQAQSAANIIGAASVTCHSLPDNELDTLSRLQLAKIVESKIAEISATIIYTHHRGDVNIDHQRAHEAVIIASRSIPDQCVRRLLFFETVSSSEWQTPASDIVFAPNVFVEITSFWKKKCLALDVYKSEIRTFPHSRSIEAVEALARWRGATAGVCMAEAFMLGRDIIRD